LLTIDYIIIQRVQWLKKENIKIDLLSRLRFYVEILLSLDRDGMSLISNSIDLDRYFVFNNDEVTSCYKSCFK